MEKLMTKRHFWYILILSLATAIAGVLLTVNPDILILVCMVLGAVCALLGIIQVIAYFLSKRENLSQLVYGMGFFAAGVLLCVVPSLLKAVIPIFFGIWIIFSSISGVYRNFLLRKLYPLWYVGLILCILGVVAGCFVLTRPMSTMETTIRIIGVCLIVVGVLRFVSVLMARHYYVTPTDEVIDTTADSE